MFEPPSSARRCRNGLIFTFSVGLVLILLLAGIAGAAPAKVLILNSYHKEFKWTDAQVSAAEEVLRGELGHIEIFVEYMDTKRRYSTDYLRLLQRLYRYKYRDVLLDAVITTDDNALWFALKHRQKIFHDAPIAFCGINDYRASLIESAPRVAGVVEVLDIGPTIDLVRKLHPKTRKIVVVVDSTPTGVGQLNDVRSVAFKYSGIQFEYLVGKDLSHEALFQRLARLPKDCVVLLCVWLRDKNDVYLSSFEGGRLISNHASVPVYGIIDMYLGDGIVGGKLLNSGSHGRIAAEKAVQLIRKTGLNGDAVMRESINPYMFDHAQLARWGIDPSSLPPNSVILNEPFSLVAEYQGTFFIIAGSFFVLIMVVTVLVLNDRRRKKAEAELIQSEELFRRIFSHHSAAKLIVDPETGVIVDANRAAEEFYGWPLANIKGMRVQDINVLSEDQVETEMHRARNMQSVHFEFRHRRADGSIRDVEVYSSRIEIKGKVLLHSIVHDVTERKLAEEAVRESETKFRNIFDMSPQAIAVTEVETGRFIDVNKKLCELTGYGKEEILGRTTTDMGFYSEQDRHRFRSELTRTGEVDGMEMAFLCRENRRFTTLMFARIVEIEGRQLILTIFFDITGQRELEQGLRQAQKSESIGSLAGGIAHDFNNILFPIVGMSEMLMEDFPPASPEYESAEEILKAGRRGVDLVKQILAFSRQSEHKMIPVRIQQILKEVVKLCRRTIPSDIAMEAEIFADCGLINADPTQLHQIGMNLITNAYHAIERPDGKITVALAEVDIGPDDFPGSEIRAGRCARIDITDNGSGIDPSIMEKIFEPYFTTKGEGRGTGLGLAVVYGIVKEHGGEIRIVSEVGAGTHVQVFLPLIKEAFEERQPSKTELMPRGTERVLLVDDEESVARLEKQMLERLGYRVTSRTSSLEALEAFRAGPEDFDIVVSDMTMPNMTGAQLAGELISIRPDIPILICTGFSERIDRETAADIGVGGFLMKPVLRSEMAKMVRDLLGGTAQNH